MHDNDRSPLDHLPDYGLAAAVEAGLLDRHPREAEEALVQAFLGNHTRTYGTFIRLHPLFLTISATLGTKRCARGMRRPNPKALR
ncbi:protein of unknown function [Methylocaldum szegediense]|uniref:Uncharacterized protein n=1 Tax=Methylocaldum szegediense TaxID=73780 RepID=A0ABM9I0G2_9GAMM|nr:protein of unknown function [Methylocaldum szegediense]